MAVAAVPGRGCSRGAGRSRSPTGAANCCASCRRRAAGARAGWRSIGSRPRCCWRRSPARITAFSPTPASIRARWRAPGWLLVTRGRGGVGRVDLDHAARARARAAAAHRCSASCARRWWPCGSSARSASGRSSSSTSTASTTAAARSGIEAAAWASFGKSAAALGAGEATLLAVLAARAVRYDPAASRPGVRRSGAAGARARADAGARLIDPDGARAHRGRAAGLRLGPPPGPRRTSSIGCSRSSPVDARAAGGMLTTTLDLPLQRRLETAVTRHRRPPGPGAEAGLVVLEPATGAVLRHGRLAGLRARPAGQVNITTTPATRARRLKPFVYALAIERGATPGEPRRRPGRGVPRVRRTGRERERGRGTLSRGARGLVQPRRPGRAGRRGRGAAARSAAPGRARPLGAARAAVRARARARRGARASGRFRRPRTARSSLAAW